MSDCPTQWHASWMCHCHREASLVFSGFLPIPSSLSLSCLRNGRPERAAAAATEEAGDGEWKRIRNAPMLPDARARAVDDEDVDGEEDTWAAIVQFRPKRQRRNRSLGDTFQMQLRSHRVAKRDPLFLEIGGISGFTL